ALEHVYACFYVAPPGGEDQGPCAQTRSTGRKFGGRLTPGLKESSPVTGGRVITALRIGAYDSGTYVSGQAPSGIRQVSIRSDGTQRRAAVLRIPRKLGARIGATHPFSVFVARVPDRADACAGVRLVAELAGERLDKKFKTPRDQAYPAARVALPRSKGCAADGAWEVAAAIEDVIKAMRLRPSGA
ncbi:MAG: hypothetical protein M3331_08615, partial [Actinomycetota bacterium]|nr:hypothetical protein [Actinomycetota bacterium]